MNLETVLTEALVLVVILSAIPLGATMMIGLVLSVLQAATQIQEQTLTFVPKLAVIFSILFIFGPWMSAKVTSYFSLILQQIVSLGI